MKPLSSPVSVSPQSRFLEPRTGDILTSPIHLFRWNLAETSFDSATLIVGSADGLSEYANVSVGVDTEVSVGGLPADGSVVVARLWYRSEGVWRSIFGEYRAATQPQSLFVDPLPGATLTGSTITWDLPGLAVDDSWLYLGSRRGLSDLSVIHGGEKRSFSVEDLRRDGRPVYAALYVLIAGVWHRHEAEFATERSVAPPSSRDELVRELQTLVGVTPDGVVGSTTVAALNGNWLGRAESFDPAFAELFVNDPKLVLWVQRRLNVLTAGSLIEDGDYSADTEAVATAFLGRRGIIAAESFLALLDSGE